MAIARKPSRSSPPRGTERAEIETMLRRLEELRRAASNSELRGAYQAAIGGLDAVVYRLGMLRALEPPKPVEARQVPAPGTVPPPSAPKAVTRAAAARIGAALKPRR
jgi:hypothetical protein